MSKESDEIFKPDSLSENLGRSDAAALLFRFKENILRAWETQCREKVLAAKLQSRPALLNEIPKFIDQLVLTIRPEFKTDFEANSKVARDHAEQRSDLITYTLDQVIYEYQILRTTLIESLEVEAPLTTEVRKLIHEFMDQGIRKAAARYAKIEKQIAEHERAKLSAVFAQSPAAMAVFEGPDHIFAMANPAYLSQFFGGRQDLIGKSVRAAVPEAVEQGFNKLLDHVYQTGEPYIGTEMPIDLLQPDGKIRKFHLNLVYQPFRDASGKITGIVAVVTDVTDQVISRTKLQEADALLLKNQELLSNTVQAAKVGFYDWDIQKNSITFSDQLQNDWGVKWNSSFQELFDRVHPDDREKTSQLIEKSINDRSPYFAEYRVVRPDGRTIWIEAQGIIDYSTEGTPIRFHGTSIDISARKATQFQLEFEAHKLETIFKESPASMALMRGPELIFEIVNPQYQANFTDRKLVGLPFLKACPEFVGMPFVESLNHVVQTGEPYIVVEECVSFRPQEDGPLEDRFFDFSYHRIDDANGKPYGVYNHAVDVTDRVLARKQLERQRRQLEESELRARKNEREATNERDNLARILEANPSPNVLWRGEELIFERVSPAYQALNPGKQLIGLPIHKAMPEPEYEHFFEIIRGVFRTGEPVTMKEQLVWFDIDGTGMKERYYTLSFFQIKDADGQPYGVYQQAVDNTEQIFARKELEGAKHTADLANSAKSAFLANMSHEIRTPLGAIMGFIDLLGDDQLSKEESSNYLTVINRNSHHVLRIVDDILDLSKVEAGKMVIEKMEFSLVEFLSEFASLSGFKAREKGITFEFRAGTLVPDCIISDPTRIRQILSNIVGNAIKFTEKGRVELLVYCNENHLKFRVTDTGRGITQDQRLNLFKAFSQADSSTTRQYGGSGLGLVLTKKLSQALGGDFVLVESEIGMGSVFETSIPVELPEKVSLVPVKKIHVTPLQKDQYHPSLNNLNILVVEDSPDNQMLLQTILKKAGANVSMANDGLEGVQRARAKQYDVILMDIQMPNLDGHDAARELRSKNYVGPIVALTAHAMTEERERANQSGFSHFLTKPIDRKQLLELLEVLQSAATLRS